MKFWKSGEAFKYDRTCMPPRSLPTCDKGSFRLGVVPPSWEELLGDAISGPDGEWKHSARFLPLFGADQSNIVVARLDDPKCPVGWYSDGEFRSKGKHYRDGVYALSPSLDEFLSELITLKEADFDEADGQIRDDLEDELE